MTSLCHLKTFPRHKSTNEKKLEISVKVPVHTQFYEDEQYRSWSFFLEVGESKRYTVITVVAATFT